MSLEHSDQHDAGLEPLPAGLYVVATPLGRLADLSLRASEVLRRVDVVAAEDTRTSRVLLDHLGTRPRMVATHQHNEAQTAQRIVGFLQEGLRVALISDAGTPGISDPGARVVAAVHDAGLPVIPVPGPAAVTALLSVAGLLHPRFHFEGFLPARPKARRDRLLALARHDAVLVLYESPHRIEETAADLAAVLEPERVVVVGRELTKRFEQIRRLSAGTLPAWLAEHTDHRRGEFVLAIDAAPQASAAVEASDALLIALCEALPLRQAAQVAARATGGRVNALYERALALQNRSGAPGSESD